MKPLRALLSPTWPTTDSDDDSPVILLLHGLGSNEEDLPGLAPWLPDGVAWASLRAPLETGYGGATWFPLDLPNEPEQDGIDSATEAIWAWVDAHVPARASIVPLGFSQGGLMALEMLRTRPERIVATVVLAGLVSRVGKPADEDLASSRPPVFWGRGAEDTVIWPEAIDWTAAWLPEHSTLSARVYEGLGHGVSEEEMGDVRAFLIEQLGMGTTGR